MTNEERIEAMARALFLEDVDGVAAWEECGSWLQANYRRMAGAALAAAGVEEMVREAARRGWDCGVDTPSRGYARRDRDVDTIVREVMGDKKC
jgi:hypothetical protein